MKNLSSFSFVIHETTNRYGMKLFCPPKSKIQRLHMQKGKNSRSGKIIFIFSTTFPVFQTQNQSCTSIIDICLKHCLCLLILCRRRKIEALIAFIDKVYAFLYSFIKKTLIFTATVCFAYGNGNWVV